MINPNFTYLKEKIPSDRWVLLQGSTRSGKTWSIIYWLIAFCSKYQNKGIEIDIVRDTYTALKATFWKDFRTVMLELELWNENDHHKTEHTYMLKGNVIQYYGADNPEKIHGRSRDILIINEANHLDQDTIDQLTPRTRWRIICDFNPALGAEHWLDTYIDKYGVLITTYKDNPHLTKEQVEDIESKKDNPYWWTVYGTGQRAKVEGAVFENYEIGAFDTTLPFWHGQDFGYSNDPTTLIKVAIDEKRKLIYAHEYLYETHLTTDQIGEINSKQAKDSLIIADSAEPRLIHELRVKHKLNIQGAVKVTINEGVMLMNNYKIIITPTSKNLLTELSKYRWADKGKTVPIDDFNHCFVGDTLISMDQGVKRLDQVEAGDNVMTSNGPKVVLHKWRNGLKKTYLYRMQFDTFDVNLRCTPDHKFRTDNGWTEIAKIKQGQNLYLSKSFLEENTSFIQMKDTSVEVVRECTPLSGNTTMDQGQKDTISTMLMETQATTPYQILTLSKKSFTSDLKEKRDTKTIQSGPRNLQAKELSRPKNGTHPKKVGSGILNTVKEHGEIENTKHLNVNNAVRNTRRDMEAFQNTVTIIARLKHLEQGEEQTMEVFDLMVDHTHEYFANGVLVHNCIDALRYACMWRIAKPNYGKYAIG